MQNLFRGLDRAFGRFTVKPSADGKQGGKAVTVHGRVTEDLWNKHLKGVQGLGIVPITDEGTCYFAVLDIDTYPLDHRKIIKRIAEVKLPLVVCRSKSGGAHLCCFFKEPACAAAVRKALITWAAWLGHGGCEVFPKQSKLAGKEDTGNWINMPYFDADETMRYAFHPVTGEDLTLTQFVDVARSVQILEDDLESYDAPFSETLEGAPPCLQAILSHGIGEGTRNTVLFNVGVYVRQRWEHDWEEHLDDMNHKFLTPRLNKGEVAALVKSLGRKDYFYQCNDPTLARVCDKNACRKCEFGVGGGSSGYEPEITGLTKLDSDPPQWILQIDGQRITMSTEMLTNYGLLRKRCLEVLDRLPRRMSAKEWEEILQWLTSEENYVVIPAPDDVGPVGILLDHLRSFIDKGDHGGTSAKEDLLINGRWYDDETGIVYFRGASFMAYLNSRRFNLLKSQEIHAAMRSKCDAKYGKFNIKGKCVSYWSVHRDFDDSGTLVDAIDLPKDDNDVPF